MATKLSDAERASLIRDCPAWTHDSERDALTRTVKFTDFNAAFGFMTRIAMQAEKLDHHPEWSNVYNSVTVTLTTHDVDGLSDKDREMTRFIDALVDGSANS
ncbi:MAG: 4a-hydroxytetrahydrobiopterin dehydratase [Pseudomonadota bacterium]